MKYLLPLLTLSLYPTEYGIQWITGIAHTFNIAGPNPAFRFESNEFVNDYGEGNTLDITFLIFYQE